ncbi:peroxidase 7-like [Andrographis paniculata]|uniref:peroxidase 7-like n=1 Tax=Andrographis paniculata TaxID=175694 RepID=UPI0021E8846C|nr:peroxidase 7-like [Andrographis paniculata]
MNWFLLTAVLLNAHLAASSSLAAKQPPPARQLPPAAYLKTTYYQKSCPNLESIIHRRISYWVKRDYTLAAAIIRLHFHDCAVRGCDASVLLNHSGSERAAEASKTLRGFDVINDIKRAVEKQCPRTVSCADILTAAARDATLFVGGPFWEVPFGRKDGRISGAKEAEAVPQGYENVTSLLNFFDKLGLTFVDMVVLSGAHTIGRCTCHAIKRRLYNFTGNGKPDPSMNVNYLKLLRDQCKSDRNFVNLDATTPRVFDVDYYRNLWKKMGLLSTDQQLFSNPGTGGLVDVLARQPEFFLSQFAVSMVKLGNANVLVGQNQGEVRLKCDYVNY